ncbi:hypothetical protein V2J09_022647 [Rumex salicifolius]
MDHLCLTREVLYEVTHEEIMTGLWSKLEFLYMIKSLGNKLRLIDKMFTLHMKKGTEIQTHLNEFSSIIIDLQYLVIKISDEDKVALLICSLPPSYTSSHFVEHRVAGVLHSILRMHSPLSNLSYNSATEDVKEATWIQDLAVLYICPKMEYHIVVEYHFVKQIIEEGKVELQLNPAYTLTDTFSMNKFNSCLDLVGDSTVICDDDKVENQLFLKISPMAENHSSTHNQNIKTTHAELNMTSLNMQSAHSS